MTDQAPPLSDEDIAEIKAAAEKATKDEWFVVKSPWLPRDVETYVVAGSPDPHAALMICDFQDASGAGVESDWEDDDWTARNWANAEHIAASNPLAVLGLIHRIQSLTSSLERCREALTLSENALACFLETPEFVVTVGGNPIVVDGMLSMSRTALTKTREALSLTKKE